MKKNTKKIATMLLVGVVAVGSYFVSGTYAKYTSSIAGSDNANVAKWSWTIGSDVIDTYEKSNATNAYTFNLFDTIKEADGTTTENDVHKTGDKVDRIAPGTGGSFDIVLTNNSEVKATYAIQFTEEQTHNPQEGATDIRVPIEYCTAADCTVESNWKSNIADANIAATNIDMVDASANANKATQTVKWRWVYQVNEAESGDPVYTTRDTVDTKLGFAANNAVPNVKVTATVVVTQVD